MCQLIGNDMCLSAAPRVFPSDTLLLAATKSLFLPLPAPPLGAHHRNMSAQDGFPSLRRVCKRAHKVGGGFFFFGKALVLPFKVEHLKQKKEAEEEPEFTGLRRRWASTRDCWNVHRLRGALVAVRAQTSAGLFT